MLVSRRATAILAHVLCAHHTAMHQFTVLCSCGIIVHAGFFLHFHNLQTPTWTTGSSTCIYVIFLHAYTDVGCLSLWYHPEDDNSSLPTALPLYFVNIPLLQQKMYHRHKSPSALLISFIVVHLSEHPWATRHCCLPLVIAKEAIKLELLYFRKCPPPPFIYIYNLF